jgi:type III secretory pathway component EscS
MIVELLREALYLVLWLLLPLLGALFVVGVATSLLAGATQLRDRSISAAARALNARRLATPVK